MTLPVFCTAKDIRRQANIDVVPAERPKICDFRREGHDPPLRENKKNGAKEKRLCPLILRDKGAMFLCGTTLVPGMLPALVSLYRADPACLTEIQTAARRGYPVRSHYCLAPNGSSLECGGGRTCPRHSFPYLLGGVVVSAELQIGETAGGVGLGVVGLGLGGGVHGGAHHGL